jgi:hypothetical protein
MAAQKKLPKAVKTRLKIIGVALAIMGVIFHATTIVLAIGMMPTIGASLIDRSRSKFLTISVGLMNAAACLPVILHLWEIGHDYNNAIALVAQPRTIIFIYVIAALGYIIDFALTGIVSNILVQRGQSRMKAIEKRHKELIERWGLKVNGKIPLDDEGFPEQKEN